MKQLFKITLYFFLIFHLTCSPSQNNSSDPNANFIGMLMNILGFDSFQREQSAAQASTQVTGILRDANGDPLAFAILDLSLLQGKSAEGNLTRVTSDTRIKTDADGAYSLKLRLGKFEIAVTKADGTKLGSFSLDVVNATVPPTVSSTSNAFTVSGVGISSIGSAPPLITSARLESITYTNSTIYQNIATVITPKIKGGKPTSCTINPALPSGLSLNSTTCVISGASTVTQDPTIYTVLASNQGGSVTGNVTLKINFSVPTGLSYVNSPFVFTKDAPIAVQTPFFAGVVTSCTVSPALPSGLSIDSTTCAISGTPTELKSTTNYTVTAGNTWGSTTTGIIITVNYAAPSGLSYNDSPYIFTKDLVISSKTPIYSGTVTSCTISPALPSGLELNNTTCVISGTPNTILSATLHTVTASNNGGAVSTNITITVNYDSPRGLSYSGSPYIFTRDALISPITPTFSGTVTACSTNPILPSGLEINPINCRISGVPLEVSSTRDYIITASNNGGSVTTGITITVNYAAPSGLSYSGSPYVLSKDILISPRTPIYSGTITNCSISPALPSGMGYSNSCTISGTPRVLQSITSYTIIASNNGGSVSTTIMITVNYAAPSGLSYSGSPYVFTKDLLISTRTPTYSGTVTSCSISPNLPDGLGFNSTTCTISGSPTVIRSATSYTVIASNNGGSISTNITITVNYSPPTGLSYSGSPYVFTKDLMITSIVPSLSGTIANCTISPVLPTGLGINPTTCIISGTPISIKSATSYTVTASNNGGSVSTTIMITVNYAPPTGLSYSGSPFIFTKDLLITSQTPSFSGTVASCTISPALPNGLGINSTTCVISGTPTVIQSAANYTVTASNNGGSISRNITITVNYAAPSGLSYSGSPYVFTKDLLIKSQMPTYSGTVTNCSISPALPNGLEINSITCVISGTPIVIQAPTEYTVLASNNGGSTSTNITMSVNYSAPSSVSYSTNFIFLTLNEVMNSLMPSVTGIVTDYSISPPLPSGMVINAASGEISGTPVVVQSVTNYTVTASNNGGNKSTNISIEVSTGSNQIVSIPSGLPKTGQITVYQTGDDGTYQKGMARTFTIGGTLGNIWQRCSAGLNNDTLCSGTAQRYTWEEANSYCSNLKLSGKVWRLPNVNELADLMDYGKTITSLDTAAFPNNSTQIVYWSSSSCAQDTLRAWLVFAQGMISFGDKTGKGGYVRCITN